jgi:hypothetical protein
MLIFHNNKNNTRTSIINTKKKEAINEIYILAAAAVSASAI